MCLGRACDDVLHGTTQQHPRTHGLHHVRLPAFGLGQGGVQLSSSTRRYLYCKHLINSFRFIIMYRKFLLQISPKAYYTQIFSPLILYALQLPTNYSLCTLCCVGGSCAQLKSKKDSLKCFSSKFNNK